MANNDWQKLITAGRPGIGGKNKPDPAPKLSGSALHFFKSEYSTSQLYVSHGLGPVSGSMQLHTQIRPLAVGASPFDQIDSFELGLHTAAIKLALSNVEGLKEGWNGPGSKAVAPAIIAVAELVLIDVASCVEDFKPPFVAPLHDGSLQLEWEFGDRSVEIEASGEHWKIEATEMVDDEPKDYDAQVPLTDIASVVKEYLWVTGKRDGRPA
jgi:hypothetical protein